MCYSHGCIVNNKQSEFNDEAVQWFWRQKLACFISVILITKLSVSLCFAVIVKIVVIVYGTYVTGARSVWEPSVCITWWLAVCKYMWFRGTWQQERIPRICPWGPAEWSGTWLWYKVCLIHHRYQHLRCAKVAWFRIMYVLDRSPYTFKDIYETCQLKITSEVVKLTKIRKK